MFCVIQEVRLKKPSQYGEYRKLEAYQESCAFENKPAKWSWRHTGGHFGRPHLEAYKTSVHQSYRDHGQIRKKQYSIATISYYDLVEYCLYDCAATRIAAQAAQIGVGEQALYDRCYDVFGNLRNEAYLKQIIQRHKAAKRAYSGNYNWGGTSSYGVSPTSTYTDSETAILKQFYCSLSKTYHPDLNPGRDTTAEMQLLNKLKTAWGV